MARNVGNTNADALAILWEIARAVAEGNVTCETDMGDSYCAFCVDGDTDYSLKNITPDWYRHDPDCIVLKARALFQSQQQHHAQSGGAGDEREGRRTNIEHLWMNLNGMVLPEDAAKVYNSAVTSHFIQMLKEHDPHISESEIQVQVARMHRQVKAFQAVFTDMLLYGQASVDLRDFE